MSRTDKKKISGKPLKEYFIRKRRSLAGWTLAEVIVAAVLASFLIGGFFFVLVMGQSSWSNGDARSRLRKDIMRAMNKMKGELENTRPVKVATPTSGTASTSAIFSIPSTDTSGIQLNSQNQIIWLTPTVTYSLNASHQIIRTYNSVTSVLADNITSLLFTRPSGQDQLIQIDMTAEMTSASGDPVSDTEEAIIRMRN